MKKLLLIFIPLLFISCGNKGVPQEVETAKAEDNFCVTFLFECEGVRVYRFSDKGRPRYFCVGDGSVMTDQKRTYKSGKSTVVEYWDDSVIKAR